MHVERAITITISARSDAQAVAHAQRFVAAPDPRWVKGQPRVTRRWGSQRTVRVPFTLDVA